MHRSAAEESHEEFLGMLDEELAKQGIRSAGAGFVELANAEEREAEGDGRETEKDRVPVPFKSHP
jgi:hypothetical protein